MLGCGIHLDGVIQDTTLIYVILETCVHGILFFLEMPYNRVNSLEVLKKKPKFVITDLQKLSMEISLEQVQVAH